MLCRGSLGILNLALGILPCCALWAWCLGMLGCRLSCCALRSLGGSCRTASLWTLSLRTSCRAASLRALSLMSAAHAAAALGILRTEYLYDIFLLRCSILCRFLTLCRFRLRRFCCWCSTSFVSLADIIHHLIG